MSRGGGGRWLFLASAGLAVAVVAVLVPLLSVLRTSAQPVEGAAYTGTHSGGGGVKFQVSADGTNVQNFRITNIPGDTCTQDEFNWPLDIPITDDSFSDSLLGSTVTGSFPSVGEAEGTFKMYLPPAGPAPACESETLTWTATTSETPTATATPTATHTATPPQTPTATPTPAPTPTPTATPAPAPSATATPTPTAPPTPSPGDLVTGWNYVCYLGPSQDIQAALTGINGNIWAVYSLKPGQGYDKWFPGRPEISTISTLSPYQSLLLLLADDSSWPQQPFSPEPPRASLEHGWNSVCYTGDTTDVPAATQSIGGQFGVLYALGSTQAWQRFVPGRPEISTLDRLSRFASVLILVTQEDGTQWDFGP
jgi:hypothetical protein